jgi:hypothetical protein
MLAVIDTAVSSATGFASMSNVAVTNPSGTVTVESTFTTPGRDETNRTTVPPMGADLSNVTVPMMPSPPVARGCETVMDWTPALMICVWAASTLPATSSAQYVTLWMVSAKGAE